MKKINMSEEEIKKPKYLLKRHDGLQINADTIFWVEWDKNKQKAIELHDEPKINYSLILDPGKYTFKWQTTIVTEIIEKSSNYIKFKTKNSDYELIIN